MQDFSVEDAHIQEKERRTGSTDGGDYDAMVSSGPGMDLEAGKPPSNLGHPRPNFAKGVNGVDNTVP